MSDVAGKQFKAPGLIGRFKESNKIAYLLVLPYIIQFLIFTAFPIGFAIYLTFHRWNLVSPEKPFAGLSNFKYILFVETDFPKSLYNLSRYVIIQIPGVVLMSMVFAILLNHIVRFRGPFRVIYYLPQIVGGVGTLLLFNLVLRSDGMLNSFLNWIGIKNTPHWFFDPKWAMPGFAIIGMWGGFGFATIVFLAALQNIPRVLYEAARIDGAKFIQEVRYITIPMLNPTIVMIVMISTIGSLQMFAQPYILTGGGPEGSTRTPVMILYWYAFSYLQMGRAATIGLLLSFLIMAIALLERKILKRPVRV